VANVADLSDVCAKLDRAKEHLDALRAEAAAWLKPYTDAKAVHFGRDGDWHTVSAAPFAMPTDPRIAAIAGDFVTNLRATLDYIVWQAVLRDGKQPTERNQFPIFEVREQFEREVKFRKRGVEKSALHGVQIDGDAWTIIEQAQPFNSSPRFPYLAHLAVLRRLSNADKHHSLLVQLHFPDEGSFVDAIGWSDEVRLVEQRLTLQPLSLEVPTELARFRFEPADTDPRIYVKGKIGLNPTFGHAAGKPDAHGVRRGTQAPIFGVTNGMARTVEEIAVAFANLTNVTGWQDTPGRHDDAP
jgi:hypothetical protein